MNPTEFKTIILSRYCEEYPPAKPGDLRVISKSSEDIILDLRPMVDISTNEIAEYMIESGYRIEFEGGLPVWMLKEPDNRLPE